MKKQSHSRNPPRRVNWKRPAGKTASGVPASMAALVEVSKLNAEPNTNGVISCPGCGGVFRWYKNASGKTMGECDTCTANIPRG